MEDDRVLGRIWGMPSTPPTRLVTSRVERERPMRLGLTDHEVSESWLLTLLRDSRFFIFLRGGGSRAPRVGESDSGTISSSDASSAKVTEWHRFRRASFRGRPMLDGECGRFPCTPSCWRFGFLGSECTS